MGEQNFWPLEDTEKEVKKRYRNYSTIKAGFSTSRIITRNGADIAMGG